MPAATVNPTPLTPALICEYRRQKRGWKEGREREEEGGVRRDMTDEWVHFSRWRNL